MALVALMEIEEQALVLMAAPFYVEAWAEAYCPALVPRYSYDNPELFLSDHNHNRDERVAQVEKVDFVEKVAGQAVC